MRRKLILLAVVAPLLLGAADVEHFRPPPSPVDLMAGPGSQTLQPFQYAAGFVLQYAHNPLVWRYSDGTYDPVVAHRLTLDVMGVVGITKLVDVGVVLPLVLVQSGPISGLTGLDVDSVSGFGLGDLRLVPRLTLIQERSFGFGLAVIPEFTFPTGDDTRFLGDPSVGFRPRVAASLPLDVVNLPLHLTGSLGYRVRKNAQAGGVEFADEIDFDAGGELGLPGVSIPTSALLELTGATAAARPFQGDGLFSLELLGGIRARFDDIITTVGAAVGLSQGAGVPDVRGFVAIAFAPVQPDRDGDGIPDTADDCPDDPEDFDRFDDLDGCPDRDNDDDGIPDTEDRCPNEAEDKNGVRDEDGCPDYGVSDRDEDGIRDEDDQCPDEPEDRDDFEDENGCPDPDNDSDGVPDSQDKCPAEKETINGVDDWDGCPDEGEGETEYIEHVKIEIKATVLFESGKAAIKSESKNLLDQVALQILAHPEIKKVRIEGHTDSMGPEEDNLYLSQDRADAVRRYLVTRGVAKERLEATGYGETRPIATNDTPAGRTKNRRVDFVIVE